jgi:O-antigen/teichoic acid export membrane protein
VGTESYGIYFSLLNFSIVFSFLLDWGLTSFFNRQLAAQESDFTQKTGNMLLIKCLLSVLYAAVILFIGWLSGITHWWILYYVIGIQILTSFFVFLRSIITAHQWFVADAWLSVLDKSLMILLCGVLIYAPAWIGGITLSGFLLVQLICTCLAVLISFIILLVKKVSFPKPKNILADKHFFVAAFPFAMTVLLMSAHYRADGFLLERIHENGAYEAGLYAGAYRLLDAANMIGYLIASFLLPFIARQWSQGKSIESIVLNSRHLLAVFSVAVIITTIFLAPWIHYKLYHNFEETAITVLRWTMPALIGYALVQVYGTILTATGHIAIFCRINLAAVVINVALNLLLIPGWGAQGCCIAALVSQAFCGVTTMFYANKKTGVTNHIPSLLMYIFIALLLCLFYWYAPQININNWVVIGIAGVITMIAASSGKLFDIGKWKRLFKQNTP